MQDITKKRLIRFLINVAFLQKSATQIQKFLASEQTALICDQSTSKAVISTVRRSNIQKLVFYSFLSKMGLTQVTSYYKLKHYTANVLAVLFSLYILYILPADTIKKMLPPFCTKRQRNYILYNIIIQKKQSMRKSMIVIYVYISITIFINMQGLNQQSENWVTLRQVSDAK